MKRLLLAGAVGLLAGALTGCVGDENSWTHQRDHAEHAQFHEEFDAAHQDAHNQGFRNEQEHQDWHRAYGDTHEQFHEDHPDTRHDHDDGYN